MSDIDINQIMRDRNNNIDYRVKHNRPVLLKVLKDLKVRTVKSEYDGSGDSGQLEGPVLDPEPKPDLVPTVSVLVHGGWRPKDGEITETRTKTLIEAIQDLFYDLLEIQHPGWEINEGSTGEFLWTVRFDRVRLIHNQRIETVETSEDEL